MTNNTQAVAPPPAAVASPAPVFDSRRWRMLPVALVAMFMAQFDLFAVNVAAPSLESELHASSSALELIVGGYAFIYASGLVTGGRLGDLLGYKRMFLSGMAAFAIASLLCGVAQSPGQLVGARLLQGLTAAAMVPQVLALITSGFPPEDRARAMSWFGVTMGTGAVAGQVLGGVLLHADVFGLGWRIIFLVNVPIGLVTLALGVRLIPNLRTVRTPRLDPVGAVGISLALALALAPLALGRTYGWPIWTWICLLLSVPVMIAVLRYERALGQRNGQPLLDLSLFHARPFNLGLLTNICAFGSFHSFLFVLTLVMQHGLGLNAMTAGLTFAPLGIAFALASVSAKKFIPRYGAGVIAFGASLAALGLLAVVLLTVMLGSSLTAADLIGPMIVVGLGNGLAVPALVGAVLADIAPAQAGAASGVLTTSQQFASAAGIAALGSIFFAALGTGSGVHAYATALRWEVLFSLALALAAVGTSLALPRPRRARTDRAPASAAAR